MSGYRVEEDVLRDVARALEGAEAAVAAGRDAVDSVAATGLGTDALDAAAGALLTGWSTKLSDVTGSVTDAASGVRGCLAGYTDAERRVAGLFRDSG